MQVVIEWKISKSYAFETNYRYTSAGRYAQFSYRQPKIADIVLIYFDSLESEPTPATKSSLMFSIWLNRYLT